VVPYSTAAWIHESHWRKYGLRRWSAFRHGRFLVTV
jgi:hypothetical protein